MLIKAFNKQNAPCRNQLNTLVKLMSDFDKRRLQLKAEETQLHLIVSSQKFQL
jgi:hypothetical protein